MNVAEEMRNISDKIKEDKDNALLKKYVIPFWNDVCLPKIKKPLKKVAINAMLQLEYFIRASIHLIL